VLAVFSAREQNQVLKEVDVENALDDLYYDAFSGQFHYHLACFHELCNENLDKTTTLNVSKVL